MRERERERERERDYRSVAAQRTNAALLLLQNLKRELIEGHKPAKIGVRSIATHPPPHH